MPRRAPAAGPSSSGPARKNRWWLLLLAVPGLGMAMLGMLPLLLFGIGGDINSNQCAPLGLVAGADVSVSGLNPAQRAIAATVIARGKAHGLPTTALIIAVTVAMDESTLRNLANPHIPESYHYPHDGEGHDNYSVGVFQQQPTQGWGTVAELMNPQVAADKFYTALQGISWQQMAVPDAAAAVQRNLNGAADYARYEHVGREIVAALEGSVDATGGGADTGCLGSGPPVIPGFVPGGPPGPNTVAAAASQIGVEYAWGGGSLTGPSIGKHDGGVADEFGDYNKVGWDCSGLTRFAVHAATGKEIPRSSQAQSVSGQPIDPNDAQPGDLVFFGGAGVAEHAGVYAGAGMMIAAPQSGQRVQLQKVTDVAGPYTYRRFQ